jgi:hypothetical protein
MEWGLLGGMLEGMGDFILLFYITKEAGMFRLSRIKRVDTRYISNELRDFVARRYIADITKFSSP